MNDIYGILDILSNLENIEWSLNSSEFNIELNSLLDILGVSRDDVGLTIEELESSTMNLKFELEELEVLEELEADKYFKILNEFRDNVTCVSFELNIDQMRALAIKELIENDM